MCDENPKNDLRPEYDLTQLKVRKIGEGRKKINEQIDDDLLPHYDFDYSKAKPNRFAEAYKKGVTIQLINEPESIEKLSQSGDEEAREK